MNQSIFSSLSIIVVAYFVYIALYKLRVHSLDLLSKVNINPWNWTAGMNIKANLNTLTTVISIFGLYNGKRISSFWNEFKFHIFLSSSPNKTIDFRESALEFASISIVKFKHMQGERTSGCVNERHRFKQLDINSSILFGFRRKHIMNIFDCILENHPRPVDRGISNIW